MKLTGIVAIDEKNGIGKDNVLPWHISEDLRHFKEITANKPLIMGRKTFDSLPGILPGRHHIVITRDTDRPAREDVTYVDSFNAAVEVAERWGHAFVIGGAEILNQAVTQLDDLYLTEVVGDYDCDVKLDPYFIRHFVPMGGERHVNAKGQEFSINYHVEPYRRMKVDHTFIGLNALISVALVKNKALPSNSLKLEIAARSDLGWREGMGKLFGDVKTCINRLLQDNQLRSADLNEEETYSICQKLTREYMLDHIKVCDVIEGNLERSVRVDLFDGIELDIKFQLNFR